MLFKSRFHEPIRRREITCTLRIWKRPRVTIGGRYTLGAGSIQVDRIHEIEFDAITPSIARRSGFGSVVELLRTAKHGAGERVFLIDFHYIASPVKRVVSRAAPNAAEMTALLSKLEAMDRRSSSPWTHATLYAIAADPGTRATDLAASFGRERDEFKRDVRKLKALGLTVSLEVGYRLSAQGKHVVAALAGARGGERNRGARKRKTDK